MAKKRKRSRVSIKTMKAHIGRNLQKDLKKLERAEQSGWYKGSAKLQEARGRIRSIYKRYGLEVTKEKVVNNQVTQVSFYHAGKKFQESLRSYGDINAIYHALTLIEEVSPYGAKVAIKRRSQEFERMRDEAIRKAEAEGKRVSPEMRKMTFENSFDVISRLSQEFHEVFAFMTYNEVLEAISEGDNTMEALLTRYHQKISEFELTDEEVRKAMKINAKESKYFNDSRKLAKIRGYHR